MIELRHLSRRFTGRRDVVALDDVSLTIPDGVIFGLIGSSGAGKSTLLRTINLLESPDSGAVLIDGVDIAGLGRSALAERRRKIGMVFQQFNLLESATVFDNVAMPLRLAGVPRAQIEPRVRELLGFVGLSDKPDAHPSELSGGQKQRVGIARALANEPSILLCDEATSALDPETTDSILELLRRVNRELGVTIVVVTHEMHVIAKICERVAVLSAGHVVEEGPVLDVFAAPQAEITRRFVRTIIDDRLPASLAAQVRATGEHNALWRLTVRGEGVQGAWLAELNKRFDVTTSLLAASFHEIAGVLLGVLVVQAIGSEAQLAAARSALTERGVDVADQPLAALVADAAQKEAV